MFEKHKQQVHAEKSALNTYKENIDHVLTNPNSNPTDENWGDAILGPKLSQVDDRLQRITKIEELLTEAETANSASQENTEAQRTESIKKFTKEMKAYRKKYHYGVFGEGAFTPVNKSTKDTGCYMLIFNNDHGGILLIYDGSTAFSSRDAQWYVWKLPYSKTTNKTLQQLVHDNTNLWISPNEMLQSDQCFVLYDHEENHISKKYLKVNATFPPDWRPPEFKQTVTGFTPTPAYAWLYINSDGHFVIKSGDTELHAKKENLPQEVADVVNKVYEEGGRGRHQPQPGFGKIHPARAKTSRSTSRRTKALI